MILLNMCIVLFFGHLLVTKDYTLQPKWVYYMDGFVFAFNIAIVLDFLTRLIGF